MLKRISILLWVLLAAGCGPVASTGYSAAPLTQKELDTLPPEEIGRRLALQLNLTVADDPNVNGRHKFSERRRLHDIVLHNPGYDDGDGLCRRDVLTVRYGRRLNPQVPAKARGFWAEPTFARLKDYPGVVDCADKRLVFFRALPLQYANEEEVARRGMALFDQARASAPNAVFDCSATRQPASCLALIRSLPVSHIRRIHDCEATPGGSCASLMVDDWDLSIETGDDGQLKKVRLFALIHL